MGLLEMLGLAPGTQCDFGVCVPVGAGFQGPLAPVEIEIGVEALQGLAGLLLVLRNVWQGHKAESPRPPTVGIDMCLDLLLGQLATCDERFEEHTWDHQQCVGIANLNFDRCWQGLPPIPLPKGP